MKNAKCSTSFFNITGVRQYFENAVIARRAKKASVPSKKKKMPSLFKSTVKFDSIYFHMCKKNAVTNFDSIFIRDARVPSIKKIPS